MSERRETRDELGQVLCCHGRPIQCVQCGEEYAEELNAVPPGETADRIDPSPELAGTMLWLKAECERLHAALSASEAAREQAEQERDGAVEVATAMQRKLGEIQGVAVAEIEKAHALFTALREYGQHHADCPRAWVRGDHDPFPEKPCRCGFEALLKQAFGEAQSACSTPPEDQPGKPLSSKNLKVLQTDHDATE